MGNDIKNLLIGDKLAHIYLPSEIIINLIISFILGVVISLVYKRTHKGLSYSQSFMITNIFIAKLN
jgi:high-affinity Fe2+/Pb2+ permease